MSQLVAKGELDACPGCGGRGLAFGYELVNQPAIQNYRFPTPAAAMATVRADVRLAQCDVCGLVFNRTFRADAVPYDGNYDNQQTCSPAFMRYLEERAVDLLDRSRVRGGAVLEIGCGKGDFLRLLCRLAGARGVGYDTTYEGPVATESDVVFHQSYLAAAQMSQAFDVVICRHVIEHVPQPGVFLRELKDIAAAAGNPVVVLETPRFEWIVQGGCFWDVFHEHCNYFSEPTLAYLCRRSGLQVMLQKPVFEGQYQWLELQTQSGPAASPPGVPGVARLADFAAAAQQLRREWAARVAEATVGGPWAIWGAGAKGVTLANQIPGPRPSLLIDSNPAKQGGVVPGTDIRIVGPEDPGVLDMSAILIMNPVYAAEITSALRKIGFVHRILVL